MQPNIQKPVLEPPLIQLRHLSPVSNIKLPILTLSPATSLDDNRNPEARIAQPKTNLSTAVELEVIKRGRFHIYQIGESSFGLERAPSQLSSVVVLCEGNRFFPAVEIKQIDLSCSTLISRGHFIAIQSSESPDKITIFNPFTIKLTTFSDGAKLLDFLPTDSGFKLLMAYKGCVFSKEVDIFGDLISPFTQVLQLEDSFSSVSFCGPSTILILTSDNKVLSVELNEPYNYAASLVQFSDQCLLVKYGLECLIVDLTDSTLQLFFPAAKTSLKLKLADLGLDTFSFKFNLFNCAATKLANNEMVVTFVIKDNQHTYTVCILELSSELTSESPPQKFAGYCLALKTPFDWPLTSATVDRHGYLWLSMGDFWRGILVRSAEKFMQVASAF